MTLERYSHVMHLTSQVAGDLADGQEPDRRAARDVPGRHGERRAEGARDGDHRRARADEAGPVRGRRRLRRLLRQPRHRDRDPHDGLARRPGHAPGRAPGSWPTPIPPTKTWNAATRRRRCSRQQPPRSACPPRRHARSDHERRSDGFDLDGAAVVTVIGPDARRSCRASLSQDLDPVAVGESAPLAAAATAGQARRDLRAAPRRRRRVVVRHRRRRRRRARRRA